MNKDLIPEYEETARKAVSRFVETIKTETHSRGEYEYVSGLAVNFINKYINNENIFQILRRGIR